MTETETTTSPTPESDDVQSAEITESCEGSATLASAEITEEEHSLLHRIKEAGETGKKEWEQAMTSAREFLSSARAEHEAGEGTHWERVQKEANVMFGRAQTRGADLLLTLISQVRKGAQTLEDNLRDARERVTEEASPEAPKAPAAA